MRRRNVVAAAESKILICDLRRRPDLEQAGGTAFIEARVGGAATTTLGGSFRPWCHGNRFKSWTSTVQFNGYRNSAKPGGRPAAQLWHGHPGRGWEVVTVVL